MPFTRYALHHKGKKKKKESKRMKKVKCEDQNMNDEIISMYNNDKTI